MCDVGRDINVVRLFEGAGCDVPITAVAENVAALAAGTHRRKANCCMISMRISRHVGIDNVWLNAIDLLLDAKH